MNKKQWKIYYRNIRIRRREALKASIDMMVYGNGFVYVNNDGSDIRHISTLDVINYNKDVT